MRKRRDLRFLAWLAVIRRLSLLDVAESFRLRNWNLESKPKACSSAQTSAQKQIERPSQSGPGAHLFANFSAELGM
jgi:hypothetical protein